MQPSRPQNILLAVCGSISAYKALEISRFWCKAGHRVKVITTKGAEKFILPQTFKYLQAQEVYTSQDDFKDRTLPVGEANVLHIELANWCDRLVIVPLSANTLGKLANALADDLLTCTFLAMPKTTPIIIFPAMNSKMLEHPFVHDNLLKIKKLPNLFVHGTAFGELICGEQGYGKLPPEQLVAENALAINPFNRGGKLALITTGGTVAPLDPVRFLCNPSSGLTGYYLAQEAHRRGHTVVLLAGRDAHEKIGYLPFYPHLKVEQADTTDHMKKLVFKYFKQSHLYISAAAIGDIEFDFSAEKLKKKNFPQALSIKKTPDILKEVLNQRSPSQKVIGFAAEGHLTTEVLQEKWQSKPVDLLVGTIVHNGLGQGGEKKGFSNDSAEYKLFSKNGLLWQGKLSKKSLSNKIFDQVEFNENNNT